MNSNETTTNFILRLCDTWRTAYVRPDGSGVEDDSTRHLRLLANGIRFHELDIDELEAACVGLTETMVPRTPLGGYLCSDHHQLWSWCSQVLLTAPLNQLMPVSDDFVHQLLEASACLIVGGKSHVLAPAAIKDSKDYDWCLNRLVQKNLFVLKFLAYPLLESLLRAHCCNFIQVDGTVTMQFSVQKENGLMRTYNPGNRCSSLRDLFILLQQSIASAELFWALHRLTTHFQQLEPTTPFFDLLYDWRNSTLHGADEITAVSGVVFNLCLLLCLEFLRIDYTMCRQHAIETIRRWKVAEYNISPIYYHEV